MTTFGRKNVCINSTVIFRKRLNIPLKFKTVIYTVLSVVVLVAYWIFAIGIRSLYVIQVQVPENANSTIRDRQTTMILDEVAQYIPGCVVNNISYGSLCIMPFNWHPCGEICKTIEQVLLSILSCFTCLLSIINLVFWIITKAYTSFVRICIFFLVCSITCLALSLTLSDLLPPKYFFANGRDDLNILQVSILYKGRGLAYNTLLTTVVLFNLPMLFICLFNIMLVIIFPIRLMKGSSKKTKITIVLVEIVICCIFSGIIPILTLIEQPQMVYFIYKRQFISVDTEVDQVFLQAYAILELLSGAMGFTMGILTLLLVHYRTLGFRKHFMQKVKLSNLEKRLICFTIIIIPLTFVNWSILGWSAIVHDSWIRKVIDYILCKDIFPKFPNITSLEDKYCNSIGSYEDHIPSFLFVVQNILSRCGLLPELLLTFPDGTILMLRKSFKKVYTKLFPPS